MPKKEGDMPKEEKHFPKIQVKKDLREHVLARPDTYLGSFISGTYKVHVVRDGKIVTGQVEYNPALERCWIEVGSNCIDNVWRSSQFGKKCTQIRVEADISKGTLSFWNDGLTIPIVLSDIPELKGFYNPSVVFGVYMSSTNYDDTEKRRSSGRNGYGAKLTNTMAEWFTVETQDATRGLHFTQTWRENMSVTEPSRVVPRKGEGYTKVTWKPDFTRFKMPGLTADVIALLRKYLYDLAMITKVPVYFNGELIPVRSLLDYARSYHGEKGNPDEYLSLTTSNSEVVIMPGRPALSVAFTNGIPNPEGGVHVAAWSKVIFSALAARLNKRNEEKKTKGEKKGEKEEKKSGPKITAADVKNYLSIFLVCTLDNPTFTSQEKVKLTSPTPDVKVKENFMAEIMKWEVVDRLRDLLETKLLQAGKKKLEGGKNAHRTVKKLQDANFAGTAKAHECILILCEGDSAAKYAVTGLNQGIDGKMGRDYLGIFPLRGKILNVRNATPEAITGSVLIQNLIRSLGLKLEVDYTIEANYRKLRYGRILLITDADEDGTHIEGLCHNFFHKLFPSLLKRENPFITAMRTPFVRVMLKSGEEKCFYNLQTFREFQLHSSHLFKGKPKSFKGLGTSTDANVIDSFGKKLVNFVLDEKTDISMVQAFDNEYADTRKEWILKYDPGNTMLIEDETAKYVETTFTDFIETQLIIHSVANCDRCLPHIIDGLKEAQRKVLHIMLKEKITPAKAKKISTIVGMVTAATEYHHGEASLVEVTMGMALNFVGSNNIPLLLPEGQYGSRLELGKDGAQSRYLFSALQEITPCIFRSEDADLLKYKQGEDLIIEPEHFYPIIPMLLINGTRGAIGTGFSSSVPAYNPLDVIKCLREWIKCRDRPKGEGILISDLPDIQPWYQGFQGTIEKVKDGEFVSTGVLRRIDDRTVEVTELPINKATNKFRIFLNELREEGEIASFLDYSTTTRVHFIIKEVPNHRCTIKSLGLTTNLLNSNMVAFNKDGKIRKYDSVDQIIYEFAEVRLEMYQKRKDHIITDLEKKVIASNAKRRFVEEVIEGVIVIHRRKKAEVVAVLREREYPLIEEKYDYLLKIPIDSFTEEMIEKLTHVADKAEQELEELRATEPAQLWLRELEELEKVYAKYVKTWEANEAMLHRGKALPKKKQGKK
jgi:DNA topoisomerase-2